MNPSARPDSLPSSARSNLTLRILSALVLAPVAIAATYFGGWIFALLWSAAAIAVLWEWTGMVVGKNNRMVFGAGACALVATAFIEELGRPVAAMLIIVLGALASAIFAPANRRLWVAAGVIYAGVLLGAPMVLRADDAWGFTALLLLFAVVWSTDILGYFGGRLIGGPKLAPAVSPKKTWSGAICGAVGAIAGTLIVARCSGLVTSVAVVGGIGLLLSCVSQAGDLLESALKRRFGTKDAGRLIPGHGGVMDRLDGFWSASLIAVLIGLARGGLEMPAHGLLVW